jgi:uncharacterized protein YchJ
MVTEKVNADPEKLMRIDACAFVLDHAHAPVAY